MKRTLDTIAMPELERNSRKIKVETPPSKFTAENTPAMPELERHPRNIKVETPPSKFTAENTPARCEIFVLVLDQFNKDVEILGIFRTEKQAKEFKESMNYDKEDLLVLSKETKPLSGQILVIIIRTEDYGVDLATLETIADASKEEEIREKIRKQDRKDYIRRHKAMYFDETPEVIEDQREQAGELFDEQEYFSKVLVLQ